jgi:hypothetical protein
MYNRMDLSGICTILKEWETRIEEIRQFEQEGHHLYHNVKHAIGLFRSLASWLREQTPLLRTWMNAYLVKHRPEIFVSWWGTNFSNWAIGTLEQHRYRSLHPHAQMEWDRMFGSDPATCFSLAHRVAIAAHSKIHFDHCDDITILAIHEGKEHESDGWSCNLCDDQEDVWRTKIIHDLQHCHHPLLNTELRRWLHMSWRWKDRMATLGAWEPPHMYYEIDRSTCYDTEQFKTYIRTIREEINGTTPCSIMISFVKIVLFYGAWRPLYFNDYKNEYNTFLLLWNCLDLVEATLELDLPRLQQIEEMF